MADRNEEDGDNQRPFRIVIRKRARLLKEGGSSYQGEDLDELSAGCDVCQRIRVVTQRCIAEEYFQSNQKAEEETLCTA